MEIKQNICVLDTETTPFNNKIEKVLATNMLAYDIGYEIGKVNGETHICNSRIVKEIFYGESERMKSAYYVNKVPQYEEQIENGESIADTFFNIRKELIDLLDENEVKLIFCHNARFDVNALNKTMSYLTNGKYKYFFPKRFTICDSLKMSRDVIAKMPTYRKFCEENGFMTKHKTPRPQLKAETIYRFLTKDIDFVEEHKGLDDVMIEKEIIKYCYRQHKPMRKALYEK